MKKIFFICAVFLVLVSQLFAQTAKFENYETITLSDGSVISGYLKSQEVAVVGGEKPKVEIFVRSVERSIPKSIVASVDICEQVELSTLGLDWEQWFASNKQFVVKNNSRNFVSLNEIKLKANQKVPLWGENPMQVKVLESGSKIKYVEFPMKSYRMDAQLLAKIEYVKPSPESFSFLEETIVNRKYQSFKGHVAFMVPGKELCLVLTGTEKESVVIDLKNIFQRNCKGSNNYEDLIKYSPFIERIYTKDGEQVTGVIIRYNYGNSIDDSYISMMDMRGNKIKILLKDVLKISREVNGYNSLINEKYNDVAKTEPMNDTTWTEDVVEQPFGNVAQESIGVADAKVSSQGKEITAESKVSESKTAEKNVDNATNPNLIESEKETVSTPINATEQYQEIKGNEVLLNGKPVTFSPAICIDREVIINKECMKIDFYAEQTNNKLELRMKENSSFRDVVLIPVETTKIKKKKLEKMGLGEMYKDVQSSTATLYTFRMKDLFVKRVSSVESRTANGEIERVYTKLHGVYALYSTSHEKAVLINVQ